MKDAPALENATDMDRMVAELTMAAVRRFHSAKAEGLTEHQAFDEIIRTLLEEYRLALAS